MRITAPLARATARRRERDRLWDDERFRRAREEDLAQPTTSVRSVLKATAICLVLSILLTTAKLVDIAERQPLGPSRDRWVTIAEGVDRVANFLSLNRPYDLTIELRGAGDDPGQRVDTIDEVAEQAGVETPAAPVPTAPSTSSPVDTTTTQGTTTTTTTTLPPPLRLVAAESPLRVYVAGDSQAEFLGQAVATGSGDRALDVTVDERISTSLARPDYFNWPAELADLVARADPEAVVLFLGANEYQDMATADGTRLVRGSEAWRGEWSRRLAITLDLLEADHRRVFWVGQPPMRDGLLDEGVAVINDLARPVVAARSGVVFVDIWELFGGSGEYHELIEGPDGEEARARADDGVHLTRTAASWVSDLVLAEMDSIWTFATDPG